MKTHQQTTAIWQFILELRACLQARRIPAAVGVTRLTQAGFPIRRAEEVRDSSRGLLLCRQRFVKPVRILALLILCGSINQVRCQNFSISWSRIAGGGGTSTNSHYTLSTTIGQHDASGSMTGGNLSLTAGFWALTPVQTPGAPLLRIFLTSSNTAVVSWPAPSAGWTLQHCPNPATANWSAADGTVHVAGGENQVIISAPTGNRFYRLVHP